MIPAQQALERYIQIPANERHHHALPLPLRLSRTQFPAILHRMGATRVAEVGVWKGAYSAWLASRLPTATVLAIDPWATYPTWKDPRNRLDLMAAVEAEASDRLGRYPNVRILKQTSVAAAALITDGTLDFVYIDANHGKAAVLEDITTWTPKLRPGGILAGHDYRRLASKPMIEVIEAVQTYTQAAGIRPWFITARDTTPSWCWVV